jgi:hypothetical protein
VALTSRVAAGALAGVVVAGTLMTPALARWRATGTGTGTAPTSTAAARVVTLTLATAPGKTVKASGTAGTAAPYSTTVTVVLCKDNTWPCPAARVAATLTATAVSGSPSYTATSGNLNGILVYGQATQIQSNGGSGWKDYSPTAGPVTP